MNSYEIEVRPQPGATGSDNFQIYTETVQALTTADAIKKVERMNPGCIVGAQVRYCGSSDNGNFGGGGSDLGDIGGYAALFAALFVLWLFIEFWYLAIPLSILGGIVWWQNRNN